METRDVFLSADERYDIWEVKRAERPVLLKIEAVNENISEHANEEDDSLLLPLVDGADVYGWRASQIIRTSDYIQSFLNVGAGCNLLRRESQLPILSTKSREKWETLRRRLLRAPMSTATRVAKKDACNLPPCAWFERDNVPVILEGLTDNWKAMETCRWNDMLQSFGDHQWRFSDTHGACMTLLTYDKYVKSLEGLTDDAPLAVYDSQLHTDDRASLLEDYDVPQCFDAPDLFECLGDDNRPPYRWILIGPARSGTGLHIDPLGTHAWVTVVQGLKRWVLFPYGTDQSAIGMGEPQIPSSLWFSDFYETAMASFPGAVEILQVPGETIYVPAGWPHLVLNLEDTVAITQNYATEYPTFSRIARSVRNEEAELYPKWLELLKETRPDLVDEVADDRDLQSENSCNSQSYSPGATYEQSAVSYFKSIWT